MPSNPNSLQQRRLRLRRAGLAAAVALATAGGALPGAETAAAAPAGAAHTTKGQFVTLRPRDLGAMKGALSTGAVAINNRGQVIGTGIFTRSFPQVTRPFLWQRGKLLDLGTFAGRSTRAVDLNDAGQVLVQTDTLDESAPVKAFVWQRGRKTDIGSLGRVTEAIELNERGQVLASSVTPANTTHAVMWHRGRLTDLGVPRGWRSVYPTDLNERGDVVGFGQAADGTYQYVMWRRGRPGAVPLGVPGSIPASINDRGKIALTVGNTAAVWWRGAVRAQAPAGTFANDINNHGVVVGGTQAVVNQTPFQGMVWNHGRVTVLPRPAGFDYTSARLVGDNGLVIGFASMFDFSRSVSLAWRHGRTFRLEPPVGWGSAVAQVDVNMRGQVPGEADVRDAQGELRTHAVLWTVPVRH
jgi:probable HAF family extracellular repeat protein